MEKGYMDGEAVQPARRRMSGLKLFCLGSLCYVLAVGTMRYAMSSRELSLWDGRNVPTFAENVKCPAQPKPLEPPTRIEWTDEARAKSIELLQAAVRIPTQSYDDNGEPGDDPRWKPFEDFKTWLGEAFPTAWSAAKVEFVNSGSHVLSSR